MKPDHYETLGVSPTSEDVVIRAAYRALIRHYHPDRNSSAEAARRSLAINAAYAVLGDRERRADYDVWRRGEGVAVRRRPPSGPVIAGSISAVAAGLLLYAILSPPVVPDASAGSVALRDAEALVAAAESEPRPLENPAIAADPRKSPAAAAEPTELLGPKDAAPPPIAAVAPPLPPEKPAVRRARQRPPTQLAAAPRRPTAETLRQSSAPVRKPSFECRYASGRAERTVCRNADLALLDERMAAFYSQSWGRADEAKRAQLLQTRDGFVSRRDRCRSRSCLSEAYLQRMREISGIMAGEAQPR